MGMKVGDVIEALKKIKLSKDLEMVTEKQLLAKYPEFDFHHYSGFRDVYHDLIKEATPHGLKNTLNYEERRVLPMLAAELKRLIAIYNLIKRILKVVSAYRNKTLILQVIEAEMGLSLVTGGGTSPHVKRVIMMYEKEGNVHSKKRDSDEVDVKSPAPKRAKGATVKKIKEENGLLLAWDQEIFKGATIKQESAVLPECFSTQDFSLMKKNESLIQFDSGAAPEENPAPEEVAQHCFDSTDIEFFGFDFINEPTPAS